MYTHMYKINMYIDWENTNLRPMIQSLSEMYKDTCITRYYDIYLTFRQGFQADQLYAISRGGSGGSPYWSDCGSIWGMCHLIHEGH